MATTKDIRGTAWIMNETVGIINWESYKEIVQKVVELPTEDQIAEDTCYECQGTYYLYHTFDDGFGLWYTTADLNTKTPIVKSSLVQEVITFTEGSIDCTTKNEVLVPNIWENLMGTVSNTIFNTEHPELESNYDYHVQIPNITNEQIDAARTLYFYWEYLQTSMEDDDLKLVCKFTCPNPREGLIIPDDWDENSVPIYIYNNYDNSQPYLRFWTRKYQEATQNYEKAAVIQRKEVRFEGTEWVNQYGLGPNAEDNPDATVNKWVETEDTTGALTPPQDWTPTSTPSDEDVSNGTKYGPYSVDSKYYVAESVPAELPSKWTKLPDYTFHNNDLGDITNLLSLL